MARRCSGLASPNAQLTYNKVGFPRVSIWVKWWTANLGLPCPSGQCGPATLLPTNVMMKTECCRMMRESIPYGWILTPKALEDAMKLRAIWSRAGRELRRQVRQPLQLDAGEDIPKAVPVLLDKWLGGRDRKGRVRIYQATMPAPRIRGTIVTDASFLSWPLAI